MSKEEAIQVLKQALDQAFKTGAYSLQDADFIIKALDALLLENDNSNQI